MSDFLFYHGRGRGADKYMAATSSIPRAILVGNYIPDPPSPSMEQGGEVRSFLGLYVNGGCAWILWTSTTFVNQVNSFPKVYGSIFLNLERNWGWVGNF